MREGKGMSYYVYKNLVTGAGKEVRQTQLSSDRTKGQWSETETQIILFNA